VDVVVTPCVEFWVEVRARGGSGIFGRPAGVARALATDMRLCFPEFPGKSYRILAVLSLGLEPLSRCVLRRDLHPDQDWEEVKRVYLLAGWRQTDPGFSTLDLLLGRRAPARSRTPKGTSAGDRNGVPSPEGRE
jgi:hypothetical protein